MSISETDAYIALNSLSSIGVNNFYHLLEKYGTAVEALKANKQGLMEVDGIGPKTADHIKSCKAEKISASEKKKAEKEKVLILTALDDDYPKNLRMLYRSPPVLYVAGEIKDTDSIAIAVVGTRSPTPYGRIFAENLSASLTARGLNIVSGMARGIDSIAHKAALEAGGRTTAVLGSALDKCYPPENRNLFAMIRKQGAVVSQFAFGSEPEKRNFPIRNRIICGLALGVLVIEAGKKSGTAITAYAALEEGREVFALPGRVDSSKSVGTHELIKKGAKLVTSVDDIIEEFPPEVRSLLESVKEDAKGNFSEDETKILDLLDNSERHIDYLINGTGMPSGVALGILLELELKGSIRQLPGKIFARLR